MAKYRAIQTSFWSDSKVVDDFTPEDRYFYLYLLTNEKSNQLGCYEISINQMCRDTGYNSDTIKTLINRFMSILKLIEYDSETKELFLKNWYKYNWINSEKTKKCIDKEFMLVKSDKLRESICPLYAPYIPLPSKKKKKKKKNKKNIENKNKNKNKKNNKKNTFIAPTLDEVKAYCIERGNSVDAKKFYDYYSLTNWVDGKGNEIKSWKQKMIAVWEKDTKTKNGVEYETV